MNFEFYTTITHAIHIYASPKAAMTVKLLYLLTNSLSKNHGKVILIWLSKAAWL